MSNVSNQNPPSPHGQEPLPVQPPEHKTASARSALIGIGLLLTVLAILAVIGIVRRVHQSSVLSDRTRELAAPPVIVAVPRPGAPVNSFALPGNVTAYTDSPIYARTSGYLTRWYYDIGTRVRKGALLAEISTPELDQQLAQAKADLANAQANANNARIQADRYSGLVQSSAVSRQDTDTYLNQAAATAAAVRSAQANLERLRELQAFEKVYAPFDGVVTARTIDTGQLIDAGAGKELFHLQATQTLRVYTSLPQPYTPTVRRGMKIDLTFPEHVGKVYQGTLVRTADAIDPVSRTLLVEVDIDNKSGELLPGSLAEVHFKTPQAGPVLIVPSTALIFRRQGLQVATVVDGPKGAVAHLVPVVISEDDGANVQIVNGLSPSDRIIQDPPDSLVEGEQVTVVSSSKSSHAGDL